MPSKMLIYLIKTLHYVQEDGQHMSCGKHYTGQVQTGIFHLEGGALNR
jgi:hypothetical protein